MRNKLNKFHRNNIYRLSNNLVMIRKGNNIIYQDCTGDLIITKEIEFTIRPIIVKIGKRHYIVSRGLENTDVNITCVSKLSGTTFFRVGKGESTTTIMGTGETKVSYDKQEQNPVSFFDKTKQPGHSPTLFFNKEVRRLSLVYVDKASFIFNVDARDSDYRVYVVCNEKDDKILIKDLYDDM